MTLPQRLAMEAAPCTMAKYRESGATAARLVAYGLYCVTTDPDAIRCCGCALRPAIKAAIVKAIEECLGEIDKSEGDLDFAKFRIRALITEEEATA